MQIDVSIEIFFFISIICDYGVEKKVAMKRQIWKYIFSFHLEQILEQFLFC
jgi:hypothetical protein